MRKSWWATTGFNRMPDPVRVPAFALLVALNWLGKARCLFILLLITVLTQHAHARRPQHPAFAAFHWRRLNRY